MNYSLFQFDKTLKKFLIAILFTLSCGVVTGLIFLNHTTALSPKGAEVHFKGSEQNSGADEFDIPENYPKPVSEMLITTHNHIFGFTMIFFITGIIFYFNSIINGGWKTFLLVEPVLSILITFGSIWGIRYLHPSFTYLAIASSSVLYLSFFIMAGVSVYELAFKKS